MKIWFPTAGICAVCGTTGEYSPIGPTYQEGETFDLDMRTSEPTRSLNREFLKGFPLVSLIGAGLALDSPPHRGFAFHNPIPYIPWTLRSILRLSRVNFRRSMTRTEGIQARKEAAVQFLQMVVAGNIAEAYEKHVDMHGTHHNPYFPAGFVALRNAMVENHLEFPTKQLVIRNVLGDGNLVAVHSHLVLRPGEQEMAVVHIFRFGGEKIVEMWDCGQRLPTDSPNKDGGF